MLFNPAVGCSVPEKMARARKTGFLEAPETFSFTERKSLQTPYHKTGSGFIRDRLMHIPEGCNALLAHSAVYTHHGRVELLMYVQNYAR